MAEYTFPKTYHFSFLPIYESDEAVTELSNEKKEKRGVFISLPFDFYKFINEPCELTFSFARGSAYNQRLALGENAVARD